MALLCPLLAVVEQHEGSEGEDNEGAEEEVDSEGHTEGAITVDQPIVSATTGRIDRRGGGEERRGGG